MANERFEDKAFSQVKAPGSSRRRTYEGKTEPEKPEDEKQELEIERSISVISSSGERLRITCDDTGCSFVSPQDGHGIINQDNGDVVIVTGGGGNGKVCGGRFLINTKGGQIVKSGPVYNEYTASPPATPDPAKGEGSDTTETASKGQVACSNMYYGDAITECHGEVRIKGTNIVLEAKDVLTLIGTSKVLIQAGPSGGGEIQLNAGQIKQTADQSIEDILGQKSTTVAEKTDLQFDPRASVNIISPGHVNHQILGDYQVNVGGVANMLATGLPSTPPLVEDRTNSYAIRTTGVAKGISLDAATDVNINALAAVNITGVGNVNIKGALIFLN
tara:strand:+ start:2265 stop:3260 length:996 start_codon:yes stop_codon:yes gene_type:complete